MNPMTKLFTRAHNSRRLQEESGQAITEFAIIVPVICALVLVLVQFGIALNYWIDLTHAANEGARLAAVNIDVTQPPYNSSGATSLQAYIKKELETGELQNGSNSVDASTVSICFPSGPSLAGNPVTVQVKSKYHFLPFFGGSWGIKGTATMRLEHDATNFSATGTCS
jgi:Flp pilus assembly protein TadG